MSQVSVIGQWKFGEYVLYFAMTTDRKYIKVGISSSPFRRRTQLEHAAIEQLGYLSAPDIELLLVAAVDQAETVEQGILATFAHLRIGNTEWLRYHEDVINHINSLKGETHETVTDLGGDRSLPDLDDAGGLSFAGDRLPQARHCPHCQHILTADEVAALLDPSSVARAMALLRKNNRGGRPKTYSARRCFAVDGQGGARCSLAFGHDGLHINESGEVSWLRKRGRPKRLITRSV